MSLQGALEVGVLDLIRDVLYIAHGALLLNGSRDGLRSVLTLGVCAGRLPSRGLLAWCLSCRRRGGGLRRSGGCGGGRGRSPGLGCCRRGGSLGERDNRPRSGSGRSPAGPGHGLRGASGLSGSRLGSGCCGLGLGLGSRGGVLGLLGLLGILLGELLGSSVTISRGESFGLGLRDVGSLGRGLGRNPIDSLGRHVLELLLHGGGIEVGHILGSLRSRLGLGYRLGGSLLGLRGSVDDRLYSLILALLVDESEDVVQNKVTLGLLRKDKGLAKLLGLAGFVRGLANDLDDDVVKGGLGVDVGDADFAVLEIEILDALPNVLYNVSINRRESEKVGMSYRSANGHVGDFGLETIDELGAIAVEKLQRY